MVGSASIVTLNSSVGSATSVVIVFDSASVMLVPKVLTRSEK